MTDIEEKIAKAEEEIRQLQNRKLESLLEKPEQYSNEQIKDLLEVAFQTAQAQEHLREIGKENGEN